MINKTWTRRIAFTLSEVLVTLAIIGVVSALTVPTLMNKYQKQSYIVQLHKVYTDLSQALELILTEEGKTSLHTTTLSANSPGWTPEASVGSFLKTYFKIVNDCGGTNADTSRIGPPCFSEKYSSIDSSDSFFVQNPNGVSVTLANGVAMSMTPIQRKEDSLSCATIAIDTNGPKGPNVLGRDLFIMYIYADGSIDEEGVTPECKKDNIGCTTPQDLRDTLFNANCLDGGLNCFGKILNDNWQMNY